MNVPGASQNRGDLDFTTSQREEMESYSDAIDRGAGNFVTPVAGGSSSVRGKCVHLPEFNQPSAGVLNVHRIVSVDILGKDPADAESLEQIALSYVVPGQFGLRVTHAFAMPAEWSMYPYLDSSWTIDDDAINGFDRRGIIGNGSIEMEPVSFLISGGKTLRVKVYNRMNEACVYLVGFKGYLFTERK